MGLLRKTSPTPHFRHPAQVISTAFVIGLTIGTLLLLLPISKTGEGGATFLEALFTAASALCVTGLAIVDTTNHWSTFGEIVILALIQVGGFGIMTLASLVGLLVSRRLALRSRIQAAAETHAAGLGDVRSVLVGVAKLSLMFEAATALALAIRFIWAYDMSVGQALYYGVFHAVSAFNQAGFALYSNSLMNFATDPFICIPIALAIIGGSLGFPVILELVRNHQRPRHWSLHTKITLLMTSILLVGGTVFIAAAEWTSATTLGPFNAASKVLIGFFQSTSLRSAGFNTIDIGSMHQGTWLGMDVLMFIGGSTGGTAGGIKVTTFALLAFVIYAEVRGDNSVVVFGRTIPNSAQRLALTVALLSVAAVVIPTLLLQGLTDFSLDVVLFEVISAFGTVGLSTGITSQLPELGQVILVVLMFVGRLGPVTLVSALAIRKRARRYEFPEERPAIG